MVDGENDNTGYVIRLASALRCVLRFMHFKRSLMILMITIVADFRWEYMLLQIANQFSIQSLDNLSDGHSDLLWYLYWFESFESICVQIKILKFTWKSIIFRKFFHFPYRKWKKKHQIPHPILPIYQMKTIKSEMDSTRFIYDAKE